MTDLSRLARNSVALQREMFRVAEHDFGLSVVVLARTSGIKLSTIKGWRDGAVMPAYALGELGLPDEVTSMVLDPYKKHVGTDEPDDGDVDALARDAAGYVSEYVDAKADGVVTHIEKARLKGRARRLAPKAQAVARSA